MTSFLQSWFGTEKLVSAEIGDEFYTLVSDLLILVRRHDNYQFFQFSKTYRIDKATGLTMQDLFLLVKRVLGPVWTIRILPLGDDKIQLELETGRDPNTKVIPLSQ